MNDISVREAISSGKECDIALLGVGSTKPEYCSLFQGNHITDKDLVRIANSNAVGDVSGYYFDTDGNQTDVDFHKRIIGIDLDDLLNIPIRLGVAGNEEKAEAILGAIRGGYINFLITDSITATRILEISNS